MDRLKISLEDVATFHNGEQEDLEIIIDKTKLEDWKDIKTNNWRRLLLWQNQRFCKNLFGTLLKKKVFLIP